MTKGFVSALLASWGEVCPVVSAPASVLALQLVKGWVPLPVVVSQLAAVELVLEQVAVVVMANVLLGPHA